MSKCRSCGQQVRWAETEAGKNMPLDPPTPDGNLVIIDGIATGRTIADKGPFFVSHFKTCPQAGQWRKKKNASPRR
jgi:hypothetical protein